MRLFMAKERQRKNPASVGEAYAFFDCDVSREGLEKTLPYVRRDAKTPRELELTLHEGSSELGLDGELRELLECQDDYRIMTQEQRAREVEIEERPLSSLKYVLAAIFPGETNERTAQELSDIMNLLLFGNNTQEVLRCGIVYQAKDGIYSLI